MLDSSADAANGDGVASCLRSGDADSGHRCWRHGGMLTQADNAATVVKVEDAGDGIGAVEHRGSKWGGYGSHLLWSERGKFGSKRFEQDVKGVRNSGPFSLCFTRSSF